MANSKRPQSPHRPSQLAPSIPDDETPDEAKRRERTNVARSADGHRPPGLACTEDERRAAQPDDDAPKTQS
ncbi:MAG: hypothetical protein PF961_20470 [Planctomycetota bacterium]|nr:hypothetical protein [Planctomycetota bacterium]